MKFKDKSNSGEYFHQKVVLLNYIFAEFIHKILGPGGDNLLFYREGETLEVVKESASPLIVRITVKTKP